MNDAQRRNQALAHLRRTTVSYREWDRKRAAGLYANPGATEWGRALALLEKIGEPPLPPTPPAASSPFGEAGPFAGRGIMLGSNPDVWDQALTLAKAGQLEAVAVTPSTPQSARQKFTDHGATVTVWYPPELTAPFRLGFVEQAEGQAEWARAVSRMPRGIVLNAWTYGRFPVACVALVEAYYNEGWGVDFGVFQNYMAQGAAGVVPVCGGYSAPGRSDAESAGLYQQLSTWSVGPFPGFWMYAGESLITSESLAVLKAWRPS